MLVIQGFILLLIQVSIILTAANNKPMRLNMVQVLCTHVCKWKMIPVETIPGIRRNKGE
jgi:hypothetical protein